MNWLSTHNAPWLLLAFALVLTLLLTGCVGAGLKGIQLADVREAIVLAKSANDTLALKCWTYVEEFAVANAPPRESPAGKVVGVFSAYQLARNVRRTVVEVEISDQFRLECGPMLTDTMGALGRIGIRLAL